MMKKPGKPSEELVVHNIPANVQSRIEATVNRIVAIEEQNEEMKQRESEKQLHKEKELAEQKLSKRSSTSRRSSTSNRSSTSRRSSSVIRLSKQNSLSTAKDNITPSEEDYLSLRESISFDVADVKVPSNLIEFRTTNLKDLVQGAINKRKVFACSKNFYSLTDSLVRRGWLRKALPGQRVDYSSLTSDEDYIVQRLKYVLPNLLWTKRHVDKAEYGPLTIVSMIQRDHNHNFSSKYGLNNLFQNIHWHDLTDPSALAYPRSYFLRKSTERMEFLEDFRLTYCTSFLYHLSQMPELKDVFTKTGTVTSECIKFAMKQVQLACHKKSHEDIDEDLELSDQGSVFQEYSKIFSRILQEQDTVRIIDGRPVETYIAEIRKLVQTALNFFPHIRIDGHRNAWILKPSRSNRGNGIRILDKENQIMDFLKKNANCSYVLQKYIECPLLIYNTKFDIRQYFIVAVDAKKLRLWMYRNCYLKFSGQEFSLNNYARCVHLTNHTVQKFYKNGVRNSELPAHNMWSLLEFQNYLFKTGNPSVWSDKVFPGMTNAIKTILNASMDHIKFRKNSFEFFGADFMISDQFDPILLEINASPDLAYSTITTKHICSAVVEDMVKVIVDLPRNQRASTGDFECVWSAAIPTNVLPIYDLSLVGQRMIGKGKGVQPECGGNCKVRSIYADVSGTVIKKKGKYNNVKSKYKEIPKENNELENSNDVKNNPGDSQDSADATSLVQKKNDTVPIRPTTSEYIIASLRDVLMEDFCDFVHTLGDLDTKNSPFHSIRVKHPVFSTMMYQNIQREGDSLKTSLSDNRIWNVRTDAAANTPDCKKFSSVVAKSTQTQCYKTTQHGLWARGKSPRQNRLISSGNSMKRMKTYQEEEKYSMVNLEKIENQEKTKLRKALLEKGLHPFMELERSSDRSTLKEIGWKGCKIKN